MTKSTTAERVWGTLVTLTLASALIGDTAAPGWALTIMVAGLIAFKGRWVIDHYMEMGSGHRTIRRVLHGFVALVALLVVASEAWGPRIARLTATLLP